MRTVRAAVATLLGGFLLLTATPVSATTGPADPADGAASENGSRFDLSGDVVGPPAVDGLQRPQYRKWPGKTIRYHETIPHKWDWSLDQAIRHWNEAGGGIRFVESTNAKARLRISYGDTGGADGIGTLGFQRSNYVHLSPSYKHADEHAAETRVWVGRLFTHELGHVLGFNHTGGQCSLMYPIYDFGLCPPLPDNEPGYYNCRWIDQPLLRRFVAMYGGRVRRPSTLCLIEALPQPLRDVRFSGGQPDDAPVRVAWKAPSRVSDGTKLWLTVWRSSSCAKAPDTWERRVEVDPRAESWSDPHYGKGSWCYRVEILNRYGAGRPPIVKEMDRWAPVPEAPDVASPVWLPDKGGWRFTWSAARGTQLAVVRNRNDPEICPENADDWSSLSGGGTNRWLLYAEAANECVLLVVTTEWGTISEPTTVVLAIPGVATPPVIGAPVWVPAEGSFRVSWTPPDDNTHLEVVRSSDDPGTCPSSYEPGSSDWPYEEGPGRWLVWSNYARECVTFFAVTSWGSVSPGTQVVLQVPPPTVTPTVGNLTYQADSGSATVSASLAGDQYELRVEVLPGNCPAQPPTDAGWWDGYESSPGTWTIYPESQGLQCVLFAALDGFGQHGPVVARTFTAP